MKNDTQLLLKMPSELREAIEAQAKVLDRSASWLIRNTMQVYLQSVKEARDVAAAE